jgi:lipoprotein-releasing system permease protein
MISKVEFFIAWRYLKSKKQESFISVVAMFSLIGTALGVAALIAVMSVMSGVRAEWTSKLIGATGDINIYPKLSLEISNYQDVIKNIAENSHVIHATPVIEKQVLISANQVNSGVQIKGMELSDLLKKSLVADHIIEGSIENMAGDGIVIGSALANSLRVRVGDFVKIVSPQTNDIFISNIPRFKTCQVAAIFSSGMYDFDSSVVFIDMQLAQIYFKIPDQVNLIEVTMQHAEDSDILLEVLDKKLNYEYALIDWKRKNSAIMGALQTEKVAMFLILTLIMIVAAFNIISSLIMLVKDKTSDIAILRTMGAGKNSIMRIFFICGASIGVVGTIIGVILGVSFAKNIENIRLFLQKITGTTIFDPLIYLLSYLPARVNATDVLLIVTLSLTLSFLATIYPAYRAAKLNPATALKYK